jgi:hypothetical protein
MQNNDAASVELLLRANEDNYTGACGRFLARSFSDPVWILGDKSGKIDALIISSRSTVIPVLCGANEIMNPGFPYAFFGSKKIHSIQGLKQEVILLEKIMESRNRETRDIFDYYLMSLDRQQRTENKEISGLVLRTPNLVDIDAIAPLQAAYEQEEVLPAGSTFSPAASRINIVNIIAKGLILAAELNGKLVGKINVNAVSYTKYQIGGVYVHPDFRGMGIARKMTAVFIASLMSRGKGISLFVKKSNLAACKLYKGLGFSIKGDYRITYY